MKITFPSPYGVTVIKSVDSSMELAWLIIMFPSPYGVTVIKSDNAYLLSGEVRDGFRPLTG